MFRKHIPFVSLVLISLFVVSCKKTIQTPNKKEKKTEMNITVKHKPVKELSELSKKNIKDWEEYDILNKHLERFYQTSPREALDMAVELTQLLKTLKDSTNIKALKTNALRARYNVLENEALRLKDMTLIPAIKPTEVNSQIDKILAVFSSYTEKINTIYSKKKFDEEINLDLFFERDKSLLNK